MGGPTNTLRIKIPPISDEEDTPTPRIKRHKICQHEESYLSKMLYCFSLMYHFMTKI